MSVCQNHPEGLLNPRWLDPTPRGWGAAGPGRDRDSACLTSGLLGETDLAGPGATLRAAAQAARRPTRRSREGPLTPSGEKETGRETVGRSHFGSCPRTG